MGKAQNLEFHFKLSLRKKKRQGDVYNYYLLGKGGLSQNSTIKLLKII
jgi:hypothetical protein